MPASYTSIETVPRRAPGRPVPAKRDRSRRGAVVATAVITLMLLAAGAVALDWWAGASEQAAAPPPPGPDPRLVEPPVPAAGSPDPGPVVEPTRPPPPVLRLPGDYPTAGPGTFRFAKGRSPELGESGPLLRFRVAVEDGIDENPDRVAEFVVATLGHRRSWTAGGDLRLQRVPKDADHDFTVYLTTRDTTAQMCAAAGLDVLGPGMPKDGVSCRTTGRVILNYSRWRRSVPHYVDAEVPLKAYRQMVVNHEVGHQLGYGHSGCPGKGEPAPVMQQQTIFLDGCAANPWPYVGGEYHTGPPVP